MSAILHRIIESIEDDAPIARAALYERASLVASRGVGLAFRFDGGRCCREAGCSRPRELSHLEGSGAIELARKSLSEDTAMASLGVAAINSLVVPERERLVERNGYNLLLEWGEGRRVALVGHFRFADELRSRVRRLDVLELRPREGDLPASEASEVLPRADVVAITGTAFINHTMDGLLQLARGKRIMILGPSSIMSPALFDCGVSAVCGSMVVDRDAVSHSLAAGLGTGRLGGLKRVALLSPNEPA